METGKTYTLATNHCPNRRPTIYKVAHESQYQPGMFIAHDWVYSKKAWTKKACTVLTPAKMVECANPEE